MKQSSSESNTSYTESHTAAEQGGSQSAWQPCIDENSGYTYYWNTDTDQVTWSVPLEYTGLMQPPPPPPPPPPDDTGYDKAVMEEGCMCSSTFNRLQSGGTLRDERGLSVLQSVVIIKHGTMSIQLITSYGGDTSDSDDEVPPGAAATPGPVYGPSLPVLAPEKSEMTANGEATELKSDGTGVTRSDGACSPSLESGCNEHDTQSSPAVHDSAGDAEQQATRQDSRVDEQTVEQMSAPTSAPGTAACRRISESRRRRREARARAGISGIPLSACHKQQQQQKQSEAKDTESGILLSADRDTESGIPLSSDRDTESGIPLSKYQNKEQQQQQFADRDTESGIPLSADRDTESDIPLSQCQNQQQQQSATGISQLDSGDINSVDTRCSSPTSDHQGGDCGERSSSCCESSDDSTVPTSSPSGDADSNCAGTVETNATPVMSPSSVVDKYASSIPPTAVSGRDTAAGSVKCGPDLSFSDILADIESEVPPDHRVSADIDVLAAIENEVPPDYQQNSSSQTAEVRGSSTAAPTSPLPVRARSSRPALICADYFSSSESDDENDPDQTTILTVANQSDSNQLQRCDATTHSLKAMSPAADRSGSSSNPALSTSSLTTRASPRSQRDRRQQKSGQKRARDVAVNSVLAVKSARSEAFAVRTGVNIVASTYDSHSDSDSSDEGSPSCPPRASPPIPPSEPPKPSPLHSSMPMPVGVYNAVESMVTPSQRGQQGSRRGLGFSGDVADQESTVESDRPPTANTSGCGDRPAVQFVRGETLVQPDIVRDQPDQQSSAAADHTSGPPTPDHVTSCHSDLSDVLDIVSGKLKFLGADIGSLSPLNASALEFQTLCVAWKSGALSSNYWLQWLQHQNATLEQRERQSAPLGWNITWHREKRCYMYREEVSGRVTFDYPVTSMMETDSGAVTSPVEQAPDNAKVHTVEGPPPGWQSSPGVPSDDESRTATPEISSKQVTTSNGEDEPKQPSPVPQPLPESHSPTQPSVELLSELSSFYSEVDQLQEERPRGEEEAVPIPEVDMVIADGDSVGGSTAEEHIPPTSVKSPSTVLSDKPAKKRKKLNATLSLRKKGLDRMVAKWQSIQSDLP